MAKPSYVLQPISPNLAAVMQSTDLSLLFAQAPVAICIVSGPQYVVELVNERMLQFLGRTTEIVGQPLQLTLTEAREQGLLAILETVRETKQPYYVNNFPAVILINGVREARYFNLIFKPYQLSASDAQPSGIFCVAHNVTEASLAHQKLEEEKQRTTLALQTGELGMLSTDWKTNTVTADKRTMEIFGFNSPQPFDVYISRIHPDDLQKREKAIEEGVSTGTFDFEARLLLPGNEIRWIRCRGLFQKDVEGRQTGTFGVVQDITKQKEFASALQKEVEQRTAEIEVTNRILQQVNSDLLRSNSALEEFARAASHDLKEPVRKIQVFASRLKETLGNRLNEQEEKIFSRMETAAHRMALLVDDLLEYSHLDHTPPQSEAIDLNEKLARIVSDLELMIAEKNATVNIGLLPVVNGHRRQLEQLFQNLLSNALKYSRADVTPIVTITADEVNSSDLPADKRLTNHQRFHRIQVADNGIGFHATDAEKIFNVFTRLHSKEQFKGTGIGLSIAKKVVENHGGLIYANATPGEGACFTVLLPMVEG